MAMFLTITNLNVYSFIGNYTTSSSAIMTMNEREFSHSIEKPNAVLFISYGAYALSFGLSAANVLSVVVLGLAGAVAAAALFRPNDQLIEKMSLFNDNDYSKYDFSEFDN